MDFLALFLMKWGDQKQLSSVCAQTNVAWEAQELQLHMQSEINDIFRITEPQQNSWHCWSPVIDIHRLFKKGGQETKGLNVVCEKEEAGEAGVAYGAS